MAENSAATDARPPRTRSAVTNGRRLFVTGDGNSAWSRRYRDLIAGHVGDLGGDDLLSEAQRSLIKRASAIECELEQLEGKLSSGETIDLDAFTRAASHLRRILETLGIERRQRDVTPSLSRYIESRATEVTQDSFSSVPRTQPPAASETRTSGAPIDSHKDET
jgi:hypothetical protein